MGVSSSIVGRNASVLVSEFSQYGSLLDINNRIRTATTKVRFLIILIVHICLKNNILPFSR